MVASKQMIIVGSPLSDRRMPYLDFLSEKRMRFFHHSQNSRNLLTNESCFESLVIWPGLHDEPRLLAHLLGRILWALEVVVTTPLDREEPEDRLLVLNLVDIDWWQMLRYFFLNERA